MFITTVCFINVRSCVIWDLHHFRPMKLGNEEIFIFQLAWSRADTSWHFCVGGKTVCSQELFSKSDALANWQGTFSANIQGLLVFED